MNATAQRIESWAIDRLVADYRNPRKNDHAVDRMGSSIREFGFKIPCLAPRRWGSCRWPPPAEGRAQAGITEIPVILCDEWTPAQVKAFRLMVNRSVTWADWDEELLAAELLELQEDDFDLQTLAAFLTAWPEWSRDVPR